MNKNILALFFCLLFCSQAFTQTWNISDVSGTGNVTATLKDSTLTISGTGDSIVSAENPYTFTATEDVELVANFKNTNANLRSLYVGNIGLTPAFNPDSTNYTVNVPFSVFEIGGNGYTADEKASIDGYESYSGSFKFAKSLQVGKNMIEITVIAEDGETQKTYTLVVNREVPSTNADLQNISISDGYSDFILNFNAEITDYRVNVSYFTDYIYLLAINAHSRATVSHDRYKQLSMGENTFNITVTAEDKETQKTYTIIVTRESLPERAETIHLSEPGTLNTNLFADYFERPVTKLTLTGNIDARDIYFLDSLEYLTTLDLENANIVAYEGVAGYNKESFYPANELPNYSLSYVPYLTSIALPKTLTSIGNGVLSIYTAIGNGSLTSIHIPEGVTKIGSGCFSRQKNLSQFPSQVH